MSAVVDPQITTRTSVGPTSWVTTRSDLNHLVESIRVGDSPVCFDLETTGLDEHAARGGATNGGFPARVALASYTLSVDNSAEPTTWIVPLSHPNSPWLGQWKRVLGKISRAILDSGSSIFNHNIKFDCRWIYAHTGVDLTDLIAWDTMVGAHLMDENLSTKLKERVPVIFNIPRWDDVNLTYPGAAEDADLFQLGEYASFDTAWTWRLMQHQHSRLYLSPGHPPSTAHSPEEQQLARIGRLATWVAIPTVASLTRMEQRGFRVDLGWVDRELSPRLRSKAELLQQMAERYDMDPASASTSGSSKWFREWTSRGVEAGDLKVSALTPTGQAQWSKAVLVRQARQGSEAAQLVLDQRSHSKSAEFLQAWKNHATPAGSIHATYHAGRVVTGRLSSSDVNMQQVAKELRPAFIPRDGYGIVDIDYCLEGSMRILTSDLRWVTADQIEVGEKVIAFPEKFGRGQGHSHPYEEAEITSVKTLRRPSVILVMSDGSHIKCSREHRWMRGGKKRVREWVQAGDLQPGDVIPTLTDPWDEPGTVQEAEDRAYLRGILDGEGWVNETTLGWGQLPGPVYDEVQEISKRLGIDWRVNSFMNNGVIQQRVSNVRDSLRILGMIRPHRLLPKARQMWEGRNTWGKTKTGVMVMEVIDAGEQTVWAIGTSSKTMVVEGLLSHNSQIELRVAAFVSRCQPMIEAFQRGDDLHTLLASRITGNKPENISKEDRQKAKSANFALLYGMAPAGFREYAEVVYGVTLSDAEAQDVHGAFFNTWKGMRDWHARQISRAQRTGQVTSPIGRVRRLPQIHHPNPKLASHAERNAINAPVQGFASDLMQMAAASIQGLLPGTTAVPGAFLVATVHDSIVVEVLLSDWEAITRQCIDRMLDLDRVLKRLDCHLDVPLAAESDVGTRWGLSDIGTV